MAEDRRYTWELGLSASDLTSALKEVMGAVKGIDKALTDMGNTIQEAFNEFKAGAKPVITELEVFGRSISKVFNAVEKDIENISKSMRQADMSKWEKAADNYSLKIAKASKTLDELKTKAQALTLTDEERVKVNQQIADTQARINALMAEQQKLSSFASLTRQAKEVKDAYAQAGGAIRDLTMVLGVASAAIISGIATAGEEFTQFEGKLTAFGAISKATAEEMGQFKQLARDMSEFGKTSTEVANLGVEFAKAGLSADEVAKAMKTVTVASVATQEDLLNMGMTVDSVRSQFGLSADEFERVSNGIVLAANESKIGVSDLAESYKYVGSTANQTKQPLETINALLVMLGNSGIKGSQAGNGLQNALLKLADPGVRDALKKIGIDAVDAQGNIRKMTDIVIELQKGLSGYGSADKAAFLKDQFGEVAVNPLLALMGKTQEEIRKTEATMLNWNGVQDRVAKDMQKGLLYTFSQMKASVQVAQQVFIESMAPALEILAKMVKGAADAFTNLPKPLQFLIANGTLFIGGVGLIATAVLGISVAANTSIMALGNLGNALVAFTTGAPAIAGGITGINGALTATAAGFKSLPAAAATAGTGLGTAIKGMLGAAAPFVALATTLYVAWEYNLGGFQDIFKKAADSVLGMFNDLGLGIVDWQTLWNAVWITIQDTTYAVVAIIDGILRGLFGSIDIVFRLISDAMAGNWAGVWETIINMGNSATSFLTRNFGKFFSTFGKLFQMSVRGLSEIWAGFMDNITNPTNPNAGADRIKAGLETIGTAVSRMGSLVSEAWSGAFDSVYKGVAGLSQRGKEILKLDDEVERRTKKRKTDAAAPVVAPTETYDGKNAGDNAKKELEKQTEAQINKIRQEAEEWEIAELKKAESVKDTGASLDDLKKKIGDTATAFAANQQGAIAFQKRMQGIGYTCAATVNELLKLSGVTLDFDKILKFNENVVYDWTDQLTKAGYAYKVAIKDIQAGDLAVVENRRTQKGHIGVAVSNTEAVHASGQAGARVGLTQLAAKGSIQGAFINHPAMASAGGEVFGLRFTEKAYLPDAVNTKDVKEKQIKMDALKQQYEALIALQGKLQAAGHKSEALDKRIAELRLATGKSELDMIKAQKKAHEDAQKEIQKAIGETIKAIEGDYKKLEETIKSTLQSVAKSNQDMVDEFEDAQLTAAEKSAKYAKREIDAIDQTLSDSYMGILELDQQVRDLQKQAGKNASSEQQAEMNELLNKRANLEKALLKIQDDRDDRQDLLNQKTINGITEEIKGITASGDSLKEFLKKLEDSDDYLEKFTGGLGLTTEQANMLSEALAKIDFDEATQGAADKLERKIASISKEQEKFISLITGATEAAAGLASAFGETGRNVAAAIRFVSQMGTSISNLISKTQLEMVKSGESGAAAFDKILKSPENIKDMVGLITAGLGILSDLVTREAERVNEEMQKIAEIKRKAIVQESKILLEERRRQGKDTFDLEIELAKKTAEAQKQEALAVASKDAAGISIFSKLFGATGADALVLQNAKAVYDQAIAEIDSSTASKIDEIEKARVNKRNQSKLAQDERYYSTQEALAAMTADKMDDIDVEFNRRRYEIMRDSEEQIKEARENGITDFTDIETNKNTLLLQLDKETAQQRAEILADSLREEKEAYFDHQEAVLMLRAETFDRGIELQRLSLNREVALLDIEINSLEAGSVERQRLETKKVDIILAANAAIQQSIEQSAKDREKELRSLAQGIAQLKAQISGDATELLQAGARQTFADIFEQEQSQIDEARQKYQNAEEVITQIRAMYALKREAESKRILEEGIKTYRDKYAKEQEKLIKDQVTPLQAIIDKEVLRIKAIDKQNAEYERQNKLIDDRIAKEQSLFDQQDTALFKQGLGGVDLASGLTAGANYLANEDIINGTITDRTSRETQLRGLGELLDMQAQEAESKLKLEDITQAQFTEEMTRITLMRARLIQEQMLDAQNEKDKADLNQKFADQYVAYQKLQKDAIEARRSAEKRTNDELIASNNRLKEDSQSTIDFNKAKIDELQANYELRLKQIDEQIAGVSATSTGWIDSLKAIAPTLAAQATAAIASMKAIREEFSKPVSVSVSGGGSTASGSLMTSGGYAQSTTIQSRDKQMVDSYGSFSVQGDNGRWYLSTSQMQEATKPINQMLGGLRAFAEGGVIPNYSHFENDGAVIRASAGERVLQTQFNRRMENMLRFFELPRGFAGGGGGVNIGQINVSSDVDLNKLEALFDRHSGGRSTLGVKRWGINSMSRN